MIIFIVTILMVLQFVITFEMSMVMPLAPIISTIYQINPSTITYLNMGYAASGLLSPVFGYWADHFSMKKIIIISTLFFAFGAFIVSLNTKEMYGLVDFYSVLVITIYQALLCLIPVPLWQTIV